MWRIRRWLDLESSFLGAPSQSGRPRVSVRPNHHQLLNATGLRWRVTAELIRMGRKKSLATPIDAQDINGGARHLRIETNRTGRLTVDLAGLRPEGITVFRRNGRWVRAVLASEKPISSMANPISLKVERTARKFIRSTEPGPGPDGAWGRLSPRATLLWVPALRPLNSTNTTPRR